MAVIVALSCYSRDLIATTTFTMQEAEGFNEILVSRLDATRNTLVPDVKMFIILQRVIAANTF